MRRLVPFGLASRSAVLVALGLLTGVIPAPAQPAAETASKVATRFLLSFEKKDFQTLRSLFAPGALVSSVTYSQNGTAHADQSSAEAWIQLASGELAHIDDFKFTILQTSELSFEEGATVSLRFQASGRVGQAFNIEGIDTYSMVRVNGAWRVLQYSYIERLKSAPTGSPPP